MGLNENKLKPILMEALKQFTLADDRLGTNGWSEEHKTFLDFCLKQEIISDLELTSAVSVRIKQLGRVSFLQHTENNVPPDHTTSPHALSYAIRTEELSSNEVDGIRFDHGDNRFTFFEKGWEGLPEKIVRALRPVPDYD